jgi:hypothetical protein
MKRNGPINEVKKSNNIYNSCHINNIYEIFISLLENQVGKSILFYFIKNKNNLQESSQIRFKRKWSYLGISNVDLNLIVRRKG